MKRIGVTIGALILVALIIGGALAFTQRHTTSHERLNTAIVQADHLADTLPLLPGFSVDKARIIASTCQEESLGVSLKRHYNCFYQLVVTYTGPATLNPSALQTSLRDQLSALSYDTNAVTTT
ncbi:hypothetical protein HJC99_06385 [Candidatus Saccharibacteria bacterium]|nr:hypothetical protein [Candidatus Saccharibacteria bacterium]